MTIKEWALAAGRRNLYIMLTLDGLLVWCSLLAAYLIRFEFSMPPDGWDSFLSTWPWWLPLKLIVFNYFGLYKGMWRYTGLVDLVGVVKATVTSTLVAVLLALMFHHFQGHPRSVPIIDWALTLLTVGGVRVIIRLFFARAVGFHFLPGFIRLKGATRRRLMVVGAGDASEKVLREVQANPALQLEPVGLLDDRPEKEGRALHGVPVLGGVDLLANAPVAYDEILIALPSAKGEEMRRIVDLCEQTGKPFRIVPAMGELIDGRISIRAVRNVRVEDLLGREELHLNQEEIGQYLRGRRILVTGAGGSIGSELVRQVGRFSPAAVGLFEISELNLFRVEMDMKQRYPDIQVHPYLTDIRDKKAVDRVFAVFNPQVVFHAAAYKHVPMQETFPWEAVHNNIQGTMNLAEASRDTGVERFVLVSTDKAVRPTNVMGATKRVAEMLLECRTTSGATRFMAVRFGNVMGSSGSAIPVFEEQIARGGPVTVTHPEVTRYFMSVGEAAELILQAGAIGQGGEIFVLEMGRPIRILDLVRDMIRLYGFEPESEIKIEFIGLRPGEKLFEELITSGEGIVPTGRKKIMVLKGQSCPWPDLRVGLERLMAAARAYDQAGIKTHLKNLVSEYTPAPDD